MERDIGRRKSQACFHHRVQVHHPDSRISYIHLEEVNPGHEDHNRSRGKLNSGDERLDPEHNNPIPPASPPVPIPRNPCIHLHPHSPPLPPPSVRFFPIYPIKWVQGITFSAVGRVPLYSHRAERVCARIRMGFLPRYAARHADNWRNSALRERKMDWCTWACELG